MTKKGQTDQKTARPDEAGVQGNDLEVQKGTPAAEGHPGEPKAPTTVPAAPAKEAPGEVVPKDQYVNLKKAYEQSRAEIESLRGKLVNLDISPLAQAMQSLKQGLEDKAIDDQMWRISQMAETGDTAGANRLAERELNRQLAELGFKPETAPPQVMQGDAVQRLHNLLLIRPFLAQQRQSTPQGPPRAEPAVQQPPAVPEPEKIGGKTLAELEAEWMKKHGVLNINKQQPSAVADDLAGVLDPARLIKAGLQRRDEED